MRSAGTLILIRNTPRSPGHIAAMAARSDNAASVAIEAGLGLGGACLVVSPWLLGFADSRWLALAATAGGVAMAAAAVVGLVRLSRHVDPQSAVPPHVAAADDERGHRR